MIRKTIQTALTWKRFSKSWFNETTYCISFIQIIMPDEFAFAIQPVQVLGRVEPGMIPAEKGENKKETVKAMGDKKEVNYYRDHIIY